MLILLSHLFSIVMTGQLAELTARQANAIVLIPITVFVCLGAAALTISAFRRLRIQRARAEHLAGNLHRIREESRRRLLFLNAISHDLRTPLNGIALQTHVIETALAANDPPALTHALEEIRASSVLAAAILDALLQYAHTDIDPNVIAPVNLKELIQETADPFRAAAEEKSVAFSQSAPADLVVQTDAAKLQRILANLLDNAVKFTSRGSISVSARISNEQSVLATPENQRPLQSPQHNSKQCLLVEVRDTGCGIPTHDQERLFREFFQGNNPSRDARLGLGLGVVIARRLAEKLGGSLECTSTPHEGSTFRVHLPLSAPTAQEFTL